jgi:hypothetical protein
MILKLTIAFLGIALWPINTLGQQQSGAQQSQQANRAGNQPGTRSAPDPTATRGDLEAFAMRIEAKLEQAQKQIEDAQKDHEARLKVLEENYRTLSDVQQSGQQALQQIAKQDKDGRSFLRIDASHEDTGKELQDAIVAFAPTVGTVVLRNTRNFSQPVEVNGETYDVLANSVRRVSVPYGDFVVRKKNPRAYLRWHFYYPKTTATVNVN